MDRRRILIEASDGTDASLMGYTHSDLRHTLSWTKEEPPAAPVAVEIPPIPHPVRERWWQVVWRILNTDIFELWRLYGPKSIRRD